MTFDKNDPQLDASDPRVIKYKGQNYLTTLSYLRPVFSKDGIRFSEEYEFQPIYGEGALESFGIEDCRVATIENSYYLTYTEVSPIAVGVGLIITNDWKTFERKGMIFPPHNKDCVFLKKRFMESIMLFIVPAVRSWAVIICGWPNLLTECIGGIIGA